MRPTFHLDTDSDASGQPVRPDQDFGALDRINGKFDRINGITAP